MPISKSPARSNEWVSDLCVSLGADPADLVPFDKYAKAAESLITPSSAARALAAGAPNIERVDRLVKSIAAGRGLQLGCRRQHSARGGRLGLNATAPPDWRPNRICFAGPGLAASIAGGGQSRAEILPTWMRPGLPWRRCQRQGPTFLGIGTGDNISVGMTLGGGHPVPKNPDAIWNVRG